MSNCAKNVNASLYCLANETNALARGFILYPSTCCPTPSRTSQPAKQTAKLNLRLPLLN